MDLLRDLFATRRYSFQLAIAVGMIVVHVGFWQGIATYLIVIHLDQRLQFWAMSSTRATAWYLADITGADRPADDLIMRSTERRCQR